MTVFVTLLGQILTRRSLKTGFSIAELAMRIWIIQPGSLITHWQNVKSVGNTIIGIASLTAALVILLFTTASSALVALRLIYGAAQPKTLYGLVKSDFADQNFIEQNCQTPITADMDPW